MAWIKVKITQFSTALKENQAEQMHTDEFRKFMSSLQMEKRFSMTKGASGKKGKIECTNPNTGRSMLIDADTWNLFSKAIKDTLKGGRELTFTEMVEGIYRYLKSRKIAFANSVEWYAVTVKHDLHARKIIRVFTVKGRKLHSLDKEYAKK